MLASAEAMASDFEPLPAPSERVSSAWRVPVIVAILAGLGVLALVTWLGRPGSQADLPPVPAQLPPLDDAAEAYTPQIEISQLELSRWANFLGQTVIYLDGVLTNHGSRRILALELTVEFLDLQQQVVLRETARPVGSARAGQRPTALGPSERRPFRLAFEHLPADWNRGRPRIRITGLLLD